MQYRSLGRTGMEVSAIGFGAWAIGGSWGPQDENDSLAALNKAIDLGVNFIDTAAGYGNGKSERLIAQVLKGRSERVYVATKTPPLPGNWPPSPYDVAEERYPESYLRQNVEERLRNLQTDCIDLLQLHTWTRAWNKNPKPFEVLRQLQAEGKIRAIGVSTPEQDQNSVIDLMRKGYVDSVQVIYNIFEQEPAAELLPEAAELGVGILVRVVFDEGVLAGKYTAATTFAEDDFRRNYFAGDRLGARRGARGQGQGGAGGHRPERRPGCARLCPGAPGCEHRHPRHPQCGPGRSQCRRRRHGAPQRRSAAAAAQACLDARLLVRRQVAIPNQ